MGFWFDMASFYHIYPLGLCGCSHENDAALAALNGSSQENDHARETAVAGPRPFETLTAWADHAADLGFTAIYIGPLFQSATHGYDTIDFRQIDSRLGANDQFKAWVAHCHDRGIAVVVDGVFNHTGRDFFAFRDLRAAKWDSWARDWYCGVNFDGDTGFNDGFWYESWRGIDILPRLNLANPDVRRHLLDAVGFWMDEFNIDGIRLDSADVLSFDFLWELRDFTRAKRPDFWLMGEVIHGDYGRWVNDGMLDSVTNYELHKAIYSAHNSHNYFEMGHNVQRLFGSYGLCRGARLYNFCDNQDVNRIASMLNDERDLVPVYVFLFSILGIPSVYYGSEFGIEGTKQGHDARSDDPLRPALDLAALTSGGGDGNGAPANPHPEITRLISLLNGLKAANPALSYGRYEELQLQNKTYVFGRVLDADDLENPDGRAVACVTVLNNGDEAAELWVPLEKLGAAAQATFVDNLVNATPLVLENGCLHLTIEPHDGLIARLVA